MNNTPTDGGLAFPYTLRCVSSNSVGAHDRKTYETLTTGGMSLRDWFAGQALNALALVAADRHDIGDWPTVATSAYTIADAMLAAREAK